MKTTVISFLVYLYVTLSIVYFFSPYAIKFFLYGPEKSRIVYFKLDRSHILFSILWPIGVLKNIIKPYEINVRASNRVIDTYIIASIPEYAKIKNVKLYFLDNSSRSVSDMYSKIALCIMNSSVTLPVVAIVKESTTHSYDVIEVSTPGVSVDEIIDIMKKASDEMSKYSDDIVLKQILYSYVIGE